MPMAYPQQNTAHFEEEKQMEKEKYSNAELEIVLIDNSDIITESPIDTEEEFL